MIKEVVVLFALIPTVLWINAFKINWNAMYPTLKNNEYKYTVKVDTYNRNDIIVFRPWVSKDRTFFVKRIIWLPWEELKIKDWKIYIKENGVFKELEENFLDKENKWRTFIMNSTKEAIFKIPEWKFFVLWDNRNHSVDSRTCFSYKCFDWWRDEFVNKKNIIWVIN